MTKRVVITGLGVVSPNGLGLNEFMQALKTNKSGLKFQPKMKEYNCRCQVGGSVEIAQEIIDQLIPTSHQKRMSEAMIFALIAALECAKDSKLNFNAYSEDESEAPHWDIGCIIGSTNNGTDILMTDAGPKILSGETKKLGISIVEKTMTSGVSAKIAGVLGLGNKVSTNSAACSTGAEAILDAYHHIKAGRARAMFAGASEGGAPYQWCGFDAMRIINSKFNDCPEKASRPFSESSSSFIPGCGAGVLLLEDYDSAVKRGAKIYAEVLGGFANCGGQRLGGSMTAPNSTAVIRCIQGALQEANIEANQIDYINGHLTGTFGDPIELKNWAAALNLTPQTFPYINGTKGLIGHGLSASGAIETIATVIQMQESFIHASVNSEDLYPELSEYREKIPQQTISKKIHYAAKASFGFGDVNCVLILKNMRNE